MAVYNLGPTAGGRIGEAFGTGLANLAHQKLAQVQQRHAKTQLEDTLSKLNINPAAAGLPESTLNQYAKQQLQAPQEAAYAQALQQIMGGGEAGQESQSLQLPGGINQKQATELTKIALQQKDLQERKEERRENTDAKVRHELEPLIRGQREDFKNAGKLKSIASRMKENILKNKAKFPGTIAGALKPQQFYSDPDVRKYIADSNQLVLNLAGSRKGQPTNYKIRLEQLGKVDVSQPIETQIAILDDIIKDSNSIERRQGTLQGLLKEKGKYTHGIFDELEAKQQQEDQQKQQLAMQELPEQGRQFAEGSQWETSDGSIYEYNNGSWNLIA